MGANNSEAPQRMGLLDGEDVLLELRSLRQLLRELQPQVQAPQPSRQQEEWIQVSRVMDRLLLGVYVLFISTSFITTALLWAKS